MDENLKVEVLKGVFIYKAKPNQLKDIDEVANSIKESENEERQDSGDSNS